MPETPAPARPASAPWTLLALLAIGTALVLGYRDALDGPFVFDDGPAIVENPTIRDLERALAPPHDRGLPVTGRPLVNLSFALNYALGGLEPRGYHVINILIHGLAALALFGLVRRTVRLVAPAGEPGAALFGGLAAAVWAAHPLQTAAVSYVSQRAEIMVGALYLLTLYAFARAVTPGGARPRGWLALSALACLAGMATKEVMVSAPLVVLLFDRAFVAGSFAAAWRQRRGYYLALGATWGLLAWLMLGTGGRAGTAGFGLGIAPLAYALTQCGAIVHYLRLAVWPDELVFDYGGAVLAAGAIEVLPQALLLAALLAGTAVALRRWPRAGFLGAMFFAILAPTSSVVPLADTMFEHRMYLPLAPLVVGVLWLARSVAPRLTLAAAALLAVGLGLLAAERNRVYASELALWQDTVAKRPRSVRAHYTLGSVLAADERWAEALAEYDRALALDPRSAPAHNNAGNALVQLGRLAEAVPHYEAALQVAPSADTHSNLGNALVRLGRPPEARRHYEAALALRPGHADAHNNLGNLLAQSGELKAAALHYEAALQARPDLADAHANLGNVLAQSGRVAEAIPHYERALRLRPDFLHARFNLALALTKLRRWPEAIALYEDLLRRAPTYPGARQQLARAQAMRDVYGK